VFVARCVFPAPVSCCRSDGTQVDRHIDASRVSCEEGRWLLRGKKDVMPVYMLIAASAGVRWEYLHLSRDSAGALLVWGTFRTRGVVMLVPVGSTMQWFMRFESSVAP